MQPAHQVMRLEFSRFVERDLDEIAGYIAQDNPPRAVTFIREKSSTSQASSLNLSLALALVIDHLTSLKSLSVDTSLIYDRLSITSSLIRVRGK